MGAGDLFKSPRIRSIAFSERLQLELADLAGHIALLRRSGPQTIRRKEVNSNAREINDLSCSDRAVAGNANRQF
jgi:hypothetical protein